jgi:hypothetical protein
MADITIKFGDRLPKVSRQFLQDGAAVDLTGATVAFNMFRASTGVQVITNGSCTVVTAGTGRVEYPWTATDATLVADFYLASFTATFSGPRLLTAPNDGMLTIQIVGTTAADWSYTGNPSSRTIDKVRFLCGDTNSANQQIMDDEIVFLLTEWNSDAYTAAAFACEAIAGKFQAKADYSRSVGDLSISTQFGASAKGYMDRATRLRASALRAAPPSPNWDVDGYPESSDMTIGFGRNIGFGSAVMPPVQDYPE